MFKNSKTSYGVVAIFLHWLMALTVFGLFGLGLYMVYQWVTQILKGDIKLHSEPQSDAYFKTQFIITLPDLTAKSHYH